MAEDYALEMEIQEDELDIEWLDQPKLMAKYTGKYAEARERRDLLKEELEFTRAELDMKIRKDPEKFDIAKVTNDAINSVVITNEEYQIVAKRLIKANYQVNILQGVVQAIEQRKQALENLVRLHGQSYFAGPAIPRDLREVREERQKAIDKRIGLKMKRTKSQDNGKKEDE